MDGTHNMLSLVMKGWCYPENVFIAKTSKAINDLIASLSDPTLPLLQMQVLITYYILRFKTFLV